MIFLHGSETVGKEWHVREDTPTSFCRMYYVRGGETTYTDQFGSRLLQHEYVYFFPTSQPYEITKTAEYPLDCFYFHLDITPYIVSELLELPLEKGTFLRQLMKLLEYRSINVGSQNQDAVMEKLAQALIVCLEEEGYLKKVPESIAKTIDYIAGHVRDKITVQTLSGLCGYHSQYYIRLFREYMGTTPYQYIINYRMKYSMKLLLKGYSVTETADMTGYPEVRNFVRAFQKYYGYTPGKIRKTGSSEFLNQQEG